MKLIGMISFLAMAAPSISLAVAIEAVPEPKEFLANRDVVLSDNLAGFVLDRSGKPVQGKKPYYIVANMKSEDKHKLHWFVPANSVGKEWVQLETDLGEKEAFIFDHDGVILEKEAYHIKSAAGKYIRYQKPTTAVPEGGIFMDDRAALAINFQFTKSVEDATYDFVAVKDGPVGMYLGNFLWKIGTNATHLPFTLEFVASA